MVSGIRPGDGEDKDEAQSFGPGEYPQRRHHRIIALANSLNSLALKDFIWNLSNFFLEIFELLELLQVEVLDELIRVQVPMMSTLGYSTKVKKSSDSVRQDAHFNRIMSLPEY